MFFGRQIDFMLDVGSLDTFDELITVQSGGDASCIHQLLQNREICGVGLNAGGCCQAQYRGHALASQQAWMIMVLHDLAARVFANAVMD